MKHRNHFSFSSYSGRAVVNPDDGKCWGSLTTCLGYCTNKMRPGKLTCWHHQRAEAHAQRLKAHQEAQERQK